LSLLQPVRNARRAAKAANLVRSAKPRVIARLNPYPAHDPAKWEPVRRLDHAQS
jgi:hypothetical protein